jgi:hypothetical protein
VCAKNKKKRTFVVVVVVVVFTHERMDEWMNE